LLHWGETAAGHCGTRCGYGRPAALKRHPTVAAITDAVLRDLDESGFADVHVLGNSLGGRIAIELAALHRARSIVAIAPSGLNRLLERRSGASSRVSEAQRPSGGRSVEGGALDQHRRRPQQRLRGWLVLQDLHDGRCWKYQVEQAPRHGGDHARPLAIINHRWAAACEAW
jgi:pimeloyl-ACP methyl ester carboxylesterase